jgi:hypothetical protein
MDYFLSSGEKVEKQPLECQPPVLEVQLGILTMSNAQKASK